MSSEISPLKKYWRPVLVLIAIVLVLWLTWVSMAVLIPFLIGILLAYLMMPLVMWLEGVLPPKAKAQRAKRVLSIVIVFVVFIALLVFFTIYIGSALGAASTMLLNKAPQFISQGLGQINGWFSTFKGSLPLTVAAQMETFIAGLGPTTGKFLQDFVVGSMAIIPSSLPTILGFFTLPFFLFFVLMDYESFVKFFYDILPEKSAQRAGDILGIIGNVMGRYIRSTIVLSIIAGALVFLGLLALRIEHAAALAALTALTQFIPIIGPVISGLIILIITLALQPEMVIWAILVFIVAQVILNSFFGNWIQGKYMQLHPAVIMVLLVVGGYIAGFWGMILALPVGATVWEIIKYFRISGTADTLET
ncbi:MAG: AI-2E family transporter [Chloroflexi bacterium]|nr:AI-2E family transporter [Chloroflexota bacterium]